MPDDNAAAQTPGSASQAPGSAPGNTNGKNTGGSVDAGQNQNGGGAPVGVKREFFNLREKVRTRDAEIDSLRSELDALKASKSTGSGKTEKVDPFEDPDAYRASIEAQVSKAVEERIGHILNQRAVEVNAVQSEKWLLSRSHLKEDGRAGDEVAQIISEQYADVARRNPRAAARSAYLDWCESKGVSPDLTDEPSLRPPTNVRPSSIPSGSSDKNFTPEEVRNMMFNAKTKEERDRISQEVTKAYKEGRFRGQVIKLR